jgi:hypothetical protein
LTRDDLILYGTLLTVAALVLWLSVWAIRHTKTIEAVGSALTAAELRDKAAKLLLGGPFMWGTWHGLRSVRTTRLQLRDDTDADVTEITFNLIPEGDVLQWFVLDGRRYECVNEGLLRGRAWLRDAQTQEVVMSCDHRMIRDHFYQGRSDQRLFSVGPQNMLSGYARVTRSGVEIGRFFEVLGCYAHVLSLKGQTLTPLQMCFLFLSRPGRS